MSCDICVLIEPMRPTSICQFFSYGGLVRDVGLPRKCCPESRSHVISRQESSSVFLWTELVVVGIRRDRLSVENPSEKKTHYSSACMHACNCKYNFSRVFFGAHTVARPRD